jgi:hypothetical protein
MIANGDPGSLSNESTKGSHPHLSEIIGFPLHDRGDSEVYRYTSPIGAIELGIWLNEVE